MRNIGTSVRATELGVSLLCAIALAFAFPKAGLAWLAPLGAAGLFWAWQRLSWKRAFFAGWFAGAIFFSISFSWFTYTVGSDVGPFAFAIVFIPALVDGLAFALAALCTNAAASVLPAWVVPLAGAAAFTYFEWLRSIGVTGVPFAQVGYSQTSTPLAVFAAYAGCYGVTFAVMLLGGYIAHAAVTRRPAVLGIAVLVVAAGWGAAYAAWPARHAPAPFMRVAAVQGNVPQSLKATNLDLSVQRYVAMTKRLKPLHPALIVWPETVILTDLDFTPQYFDAGSMSASERADVMRESQRAQQLRATFSNLAKTLNAQLVVGSQDLHWGAEGFKRYNALYTYAPDGQLIDVYDKRQLVPFAESLPAPAIFGHLPYADLIGRFGHGTQDAVVPAGPMRFAPLICWESAFSDLVHAQLVRGAQFLVIPTDDAWFGPSSGTYQHAQIAQMRAIESGEWVVQAASTGISGIISPAGAWIDHADLDRQALVVGTIGLPAGSIFARIGPTPVAYAAAALYVLLLAAGIAVRRRA